MKSVWAVVVAALFLSGGAQAIPPLCGPRDEIAKELAAKFGEYPIWSGTSQRSGRLLELYAKSNQSTWTIVSVEPNDYACIVSVGIDGQLRVGAFGNQL